MHNRDRMVNPADYTQSLVLGGFGPYRGYPRHPVFTQNRSPDYFLCLTFGPKNKLRDWRTFAR